jgi:hypothetical protein
MSDLVIFEERMYLFWEQTDTHQLQHSWKGKKREDDAKFTLMFGRSMKFLAM